MRFGITMRDPAGDWLVQMAAHNPTSAMRSVSARSQKGHGSAVMTPSSRARAHAFSCRDTRAPPITIAAGHAVLVSVLSVGIVSLAVVGAFSHITRALEVGLPWVVAIAVLSCGTYVVRHHR